MTTRYDIPSQDVRETPATFTVRPLTAAELQQAAGGLLLPAVQKIREAAARYDLGRAVMQDFHF